MLYVAGHLLPVSAAMAHEKERKQSAEREKMQKNQPFKPERKGSSGAASALTDPALHAVWIQATPRPILREEMSILCIYVAISQRVKTTVGLNNLPQDEINEAPSEESV